MRKFSFFAAAVLAVVGCNGSGLPQAGDTVVPRIVNEVKWEPGSKVDLRVELSATATTGQQRRLGFGASPRNNPVAEVQFFDAKGGSITSQTVELATRC